MSPILGIIASSKLTVQNSYESISTVTVGSGGTSSISFTSIPNTFTHLQIRALARGGFAGVREQTRVRFNGSTSTYASHWVEGDGSSASAGETWGDSEHLLRFVSGNGSTASVFGTYVLDILDYANTSKAKTVRTLIGYDANGSGYVSLDSGLWTGTAAISSISLTPKDGSSWLQYSSFALYGIKGA